MCNLSTKCGCVGGALHSHLGQFQIGHVQRQTAEKNDKWQEKGVKSRHCFGLLSVFCLISLFPHAEIYSCHKRWFSQSNPQEHRRFHSRGTSFSTRFL
jgi:hypothetical protein